MNLKKLSLNEILIHGFSLILLFLAAYYYLERTLPFDGAFYSFRISETGWFCIDNYRYGVQHTQLLPLLLLKAGCSLKVFLVSYSVSFVLWNYIICLVILYVYKLPKMAVGLVLATILSYTYKFFYPVSEIHSTTAPLFLFAAHVFHYQDRKNNFVYFLIAALCITWFLLIHVISIIPAFFILGYYGVYSKTLKKDFVLFIFTAGLLIVEFMLSKTFLTTDYLASKMIGIKEIIRFLSNPGAAPGFVYFKQEFLFNYLPLEIAYVICISFLAIKKEYLQLLTLVVATIGTWLIIMAYNLSAESPIVYMNYYGLFGLYIAFPLCLFVADHIQEKKFGVIYVLLIAGSLVGVVRSGALIGDQVDYYKRVTSNMKTSKGIVRPANLDWSSLWMAWDLSFQSLLVSSVQGPQGSKTFFSLNNESFLKKHNVLTDANFLFNTFFAPGWFRPPLTNQKFYGFENVPYKFLNSVQDDSFNDSLLSNKNMEISTNTRETIYLLKNNDRTIPVTVINHNNILIPSAAGNSKQINLSYHVLDSKKKMLLLNGKRSPLEMDIMPNMALSTGVSIDCTQLHRGRIYYIDFDVVIDNKRWLEINRRVKIILL